VLVELPFTCASAPSSKLADIAAAAGVHTNRAIGGDRHHRHSGGFAVTGAQPSQVSSQGRQLHLQRYLVQQFGNFALLNHDWWVPRTLDNSSTRLFPNPGQPSTVTRTKDGWPQKLDDAVAVFQPIISDLTAAEGVRVTNVARASGGHRFANSLRSVNHGYADGHVETRPRAIIQWQHSGNWTTYY
jgi:hypothetical protein